MLGFSKPKRLYEFYGKTIFSPISDHIMNCIYFRNKQKNSNRILVPKGVIYS